MVFGLDCIPNNVPQILINREPLQHLNFDIELLGNCDTIISELCHRLGREWANLHTGSRPLREAIFTESSADPKPLKRSQGSPSTSPKRARLEKPKIRSATDVATKVSAQEGDGSRQTVDVAELRKMYKPRLRNLASELEGTFHFPRVIHMGLAVPSRGGSSWGHSEELLT